MIWPFFRHDPHLLTIANKLDKLMNDFQTIVGKLEAAYTQIDAAAQVLTSHADTVAGLRAQVSALLAKPAGIKNILTL